MTTEEREHRALRWFLMYCALFLALALGMVIGNVWPANSTAENAVPSPDWTVAPCYMWEDTATPVLPPYTRTDVCAVQTETGAWFVSSPDNPSPLEAPQTR